jgi:hypothetical protein
MGTCASRDCDATAPTATMILSICFFIDTFLFGLLLATFLA